MDDINIVEPSVGFSYGGKQYSSYEDYLTEYLSGLNQAGTEFELDPLGHSASTASPLDFSSLFGSLFGLSGSEQSVNYQGLNDLFNEYRQWILDNTNNNNSWSAEQAQKMMDFQRSEREWAQMFNQGEAAKNRDWQEFMSSTAHQREIADLKAAGLNPVLSARGGNGAAVTSGATAAASVPGHGAQGNPDQSANSAITSILGTAFSTMTQMAGKMVDAQTSLAVAEQYNRMSQIIEEMKEAYGKWEHENYPSNIYQAISAIIGRLTDYDPFGSLKEFGSNIIDTMKQIFGGSGSSGSSSYYGGSSFHTGQGSTGRAGKLPSKPWYELN